MKGVGEDHKETLECSVNARPHSPPEPTQWFRGSSPPCTFLPCPGGTQTLSCYPEVSKGK